MEQTPTRLVAHMLLIKALSFDATPLTLYNYPPTPTPPQKRLMLSFFFIIAQSKC